MFDRLLMNYVNPQWFGARGNDPSFDDSPGIQAAIDFLCGTQQQGGIVLLPNATFYLYSKIYLKRNISLIGAGSCPHTPYEGGTYLVIKKFQETDPAHEAIIIGDSVKDPNPGYSSIENLAIYGGLYNADSNCVGIKIAYCASMIYLQRVSVVSCYNGLEIHPDSWGIIAERCYFYMNHIYGISIPSNVQGDGIARNCTFIQCSILDNNQYDVGINVAQNISFYDCNIESTSIATVNNVYIT